MAQMDGLRYVENPAGEQHLHGADEAQEHWVAFGKGYGHEDDHDHHHAKKSVLAKVKEKAKKWKQTLAKKKHGHDEDNFTPAWGVSLDEEEDDDEQDPEYHGAPMYESEMAPDAYKDPASQHQTTPTFLHHKQPKTKKEPPMGHAINKPALHHLPAFKDKSTQHSLTIPPVSDKHVMEAKIAIEDLAEKTGSNKTLTETVTEMLAPAYTIVSDATQMIASKIQGPTTPKWDESGAKQMWDKGVSVKEYLWNKLEPGEEERALSQVITEAISPRKGAQVGEMGVVEKVKGAVTSLIGMEEARGPPIPISTHPHHAEEIEEIGGRRLQVYTN